MSHIPKSLSESLLEKIRMINSTLSALSITPIQISDLQLSETDDQGFGLLWEVNGSQESPMPLLSYGLSFKETFVFAFRDSNDVPITVVVQNGDPTLTPTIRSQNGTTTTSIVNDDDETLSLGWTPATLKAEITEGADGILYKRVINAGSETQADQALVDYDADTKSHVKPSIPI